MKRRSPQRIVRSIVDVKSWMGDPPSVDAARPRTCPCCGTSSQALCGRLHLHGHGMRERLVSGPSAPENLPAERVVACRRYRCLRCRAVLLVVPRGVVAGRRFGAPAIVFALALYGLGAPLAKVRHLVNPWRIVGEAAQGDWIQLRRWARAARDGALFANASRCPSPESLRQAAKRTASRFVGLSDMASTVPFEVRAFIGGAHAM